MSPSRGTGFLRCIAILAVAFAAVPARAQAPPLPDSFRLGANYRFEVEHASRVVDDAHDRGVIDLVVHVWKPLKVDPERIVVFSHGSLGGLSAHPREVIELIPRPLIKYFVERDYTVVLPMRRGLAASGGTFVEECAYQAGDCTLAESRALMKLALAGAVDDTLAVLEQVVWKKLARPETKVLLSGTSRGGFLALAVAAAIPDKTSSVLAFVTGWLSVTDAWPAEENAARVELQSRLLRGYGSRIKSPTAWIYASRDPFYPEAITRRFHDAFLAGGGSGPYVFVEQHDLSSGHAISSRPELWKEAAALAIGLPTDGVRVE